jgi:hypothetical protein
MRVRVSSKIKQDEARKDLAAIYRRDLAKTARALLARLLREGRGLDADALLEEALEVVDASPWVKDDVRASVTVLVSPSVGEVLDKVEEEQTSLGWVAHNAYDTDLQSALAGLGVRFDRKMPLAGLRIRRRPRG